MAQRRLVQLLTTQCGCLAAESLRNQYRKLTGDADCKAKH